MTECLGEFLLKDETMLYEPGVFSFYSNEQWDVIAEVVARKTGLDNMGEVFKKYVADPIGMNDTSLDCPFVGSTSEKPHPSWGFCSTSHDMAKLVQVLGNKGSKKDGTRVISPRLVEQIFTDGAGPAIEFDRASPLSLPYYGETRCYSEIDLTNADQPPLLSIIGYGLGSMFFAGPKGHWFLHGGKTMDEISLT